jgi:excinuclease UvrABC nuclease subunit
VIYVGKAVSLRHARLISVWRTQPSRTHRLVEIADLE